MTQAAQPQGTYSLPASLADDLENLRRMVAQLKAGGISAAELRAFRVPLGVYEQRTDGEFMLRVRFPGGGVLPHQMRTLAEVSQQYGNGILHVTTRQDIQVHRVALDNVHPALVRLAASGLSTKGGGGNTVRNITTCFDAGVCAREEFDVSPYAIALTEFLLPDPLSFQLPRKYKIAFAGCSKDCPGATVNDLGLIAKRRGDELGFAAYVAGGMGAISRVAHPFEEFVPAGEIHRVAEAIKRVFDQHGNRKNKNRARLRFLVEEIGLPRFRDLYEVELARLRKAEVPPLHVRPLPCRSPAAPESSGEPGEGFQAWRERNVLPQRQDRYFLVQLPLFLGDIAADKLAKLADVVEEHGEGLARTTQWQNLVVRWIHEDELPTLHERLQSLSLAPALPPILRNMLACAGAATCRLGICRSRGLIKAVRDRLLDDALDLDALGDLNMFVSGCPNACGRHPIAQLGAHGAARRVAGRLVPHYVLQLGGKVEEGSTRLAEGSLGVPARNVPAIVSAFLQGFRASSEFPDYDAFLGAQGRELANQLIAENSQVPSYEEDASYYYDWDAEELFSLAGRGPGECSAGVFDLIEVDLASAEQALAVGKPFAATALAARALLVTQGHEAKSDANALELFTESFIDSNLIPASFRALTQRAVGCASAASSEDAFDADAGEVEALVRVIRKLYDNMDPSLRFRPVTETVEPPEGEPSGAPEVPVDREADFRGVTCPLNYVKTKLLLEQMESGQVLSVILDAEGARNVPKSAEQDGHKILSTAAEGEATKVIIRKG